MKTYLALLSLILSPLAFGESRVTFSVQKGATASAVIRLNQAVRTNYINVASVDPGCEFEFTGAAIYTAVGWRRFALEGEFLPGGAALVAPSGRSHAFTHFVLFWKPSETNARCGMTIGFTRPQAPILPK
ncbi:hypothetical protein K2X33_10535 [bacterium]|nr:hypothetical protein [bacterium]